MSLESLNIARRKLTEVLGDNVAKYFSLLKMWFKMKLTKDEFDAETRCFMNSEQVYFHNDFLLALLNRVEGLAVTSMNASPEKSSSHSRKRHKKSSRNTSEKSAFEQADLIDYLPNSPPGAGSDGVKYAVQEIFLPDHALVVGRFMLAAWEVGLEGADDDAADLIVAAVQNFLKNIISTVLSQRKGYKMRNNSFMYDIEADVPNMWLRNSVVSYNPQEFGRLTLGDEDTLTPSCPPTLEEVEQEAAYETACVDQMKPKNNERLTIEEFYDTLLVHKNVIASHSIYAVNMERLAAMLNHPSY